MALIRNGSNQLSGINRMFGAVGASGLRSVFERGGVARNFDSGEHAVAGVTNRAATPSGVRHPLAWKMGTKPGSMASANDVTMTLSPSASGALGLNGVASIAMSIDFSQAAMGLVSQGVASITWSITTSSPSIVGVLSGASNFTGLSFAVNPILGAKSGLAASIPMSFTLTGAPTAKGFMSANITNEGAAVTPTSVAAEVWNSVAAAFNVAGTMGNKMNSAASGGVDYTALGAAVWASVSRTLTAGAAPDTTAIANAVLAALNATTIPVDTKKMNGATILGNGTSGNKWRG